MKCWKTKYTNRKKALTALNSAHRMISPIHKYPIAIYKCLNCNDYHLTSKEQDEK